jgi:16S rRNA (cytosine967-C5)-methyltransferase
VAREKSESRDKSRDLAIKILGKVLGEEALSLDEAFAQVIDAPRVNPEPIQRSWLLEICSGVLRWKGRLDFIIDSVSLKKKPTGWLRRAMLTGAYQLVAQDRVPPAIVVSEMVDLIKSKEGHAPAKFVNAAFRKVADHAMKWRELDFPIDKPNQQAAWASLPQWMWNRLVAQHGKDWAANFARACLERPVTWIRVKGAGPTAASLQDWSEEGPIRGARKCIEGGPIVEKSGFESGDFFVQDISSQTLVAEISSEVKSGLPKEEIENLTALDLCAAPGGKTAGLSWNSFDVTATDRDGERMKLLEETIRRVSPRVRVEPLKAVAALPDQHLVWVDAPCTGTGIIRRHPDVRWSKMEKDLFTLDKLQAQLLDQGWSKVRSGGFLAYTVCSVLKEEGPEQLQKFLDRVGVGRARVVKQWFLVPQEAPYGDGFWGVLIQKVLLQ